jgi:thiol-disulfide isomerase/thioredoxin
MKEIYNQAELENFIKEIDNGYLVIKFSAVWCAPCRAMKPVYENLAIDSSLSMISEFVEINRDDNMDLIENMNFDFMSIPRFFVLKIDEGKVIDKNNIGGSQGITSLLEQILGFAK